jgi:chromosome segregation ATPase
MSSLSIGAAVGLALINSKISSLESRLRAENELIRRLEDELAQSKQAVVSLKSNLQNVKAEQSSLLKSCR